jgi:predicted nucleic acid-binding Zn ribbon protein
MSTWRASRPPRSEQDPKRVSEVLDGVSRRLGAAPPGVLTAVFARWEDLVGAEIAAHCRPVSVRGQVLDLVVDQPAWATQIRFMSSDILAVLAVEAGQSEIRELRVRVTGENLSRPSRRGRAV